MIYSVWCPDAKAYDYYETPEKSVDDPTANHLVGRRRALGVDDVSGSWPLPTGARRIGSGTQARGMVASRGPTLDLGAFDLGDYGPLAIKALAVYGVWKLLF